MAWWITSQTIFKWVRLNYASAHHHPPSLTTIHHHYTPPAKIYPPPSTTTHHYPSPPYKQPKYIHHHLPLPKKMDHPAKARIYSNITSLWHCFNSFFFFGIQYSFPWRRFCVKVLISLLFKFQISTAFYDI